MRAFFKSEGATGIVLLIATIVALLFSNSSKSAVYYDFFTLSFNHLTIRDWINDGLMAVFFLLVGLELKKEILIGELASAKKLALPAICAVGGVIIPALIFVVCNLSHPQNLRGFAIPTATDIAFAYGVISFFGSRVPKALKVFLVTLAVLDDLMAILIIAVFYSRDLQFIYLDLAFIVLCLLQLLNCKSCAKIWPYLVLGTLLWILILKSGIHASLSGVVLALFIPFKAKEKMPLTTLVSKLSLPVNFVILPLFAFANAGISIAAIGSGIFTAPMFLGVFCGLFFGKQIGVFLFGWIAAKLHFAELPRGVKWNQFYGAAVITGIGFTMSLFIAFLAFAGEEALLEQIKIAVILASLFSAILGFFWFKILDQAANRQADL